MKRVFVVHGWGGSPDDDWRPWLKTELEKAGYHVAVPAMPDSETPIIEKWVSLLAEVVQNPDEETYFVGHSIGCQTILRYLETLDAPVGGAVFVAGWFNLESLEDDEVREVARPWIENKINVAKVKSILPKSALIISDNDPYGAFEENKQKFTELGSEVLVLKEAGHITEEDGFTTIPTVVELLQKFTR